ncbi:Gx [Cuiaba virus]|uniref:Gx n=1 Tax=Cuiaba virus TaxID=2495751 RepID=A0A3S5HKX4_9RHAB|nr:Gx [Cuiaba virus]AZL49345.1 Gx [Cuiaba virus]
MDLSCLLSELFKLIAVMFFIGPARKIFIGIQLTIVLFSALYGVASYILPLMPASEPLYHTLLEVLKLTDIAVTRLSGFRSVLSRGIGHLILNNMSEPCQSLTENVMT